MSYNATPFHGKVCRVEKNGTKMNYTQGWQITANLEIADSTSCGDAWKTGLPGLASWSGSFNGYFVAGNTEQKAFFDNIVAAAPGSKLTDVKFLLDADTNAFVGDIYVMNFSVSPTIGGVVPFTINFQGNGALSLTSEA